MVFPEPVISIAIEPKTKADQEKLGDALQKLADGRPVVPRAHRRRDRQTIIAGMGELHLEIIVDRLRREFKVECNVGKPEVAYRESISKQVKHEGKYIKQSGGHGMYGHVWLDIGPASRGTGFVFENDIVGGVIPKEFIPSRREGHPRRDGPRRARRLPDHRREGCAHRRQLPRSRLFGPRVRGCGVDGVPGRRASAQAFTCSSR